MENKLIELYLLCCHCYDMQTKLHLQPNRNGKDCLTVPELMTIYLFGHLNGHFKKRAIYNFTNYYRRDWFPALPSYQAFSRRLNLLENNFQSLLGSLLAELVADQARCCSTRDHLIDSLPIMLASGAKSKRAKVSREIAATGFCATRQIHFHGVRLHLLARRRTAQLPVPRQLWIERGNTHDLTALRGQSTIPHGINLFGDKAYADRRFKSSLRERAIHLLTPVKKPKGGALSREQKYYNKLVSKIRQPIESFFKWLIDKTDIQRASSVHSTDGLLVHCLGKLTFALLLLNFYY